MLLVYSDDFLKHSFINHPESPGRLSSIKSLLDKKKGIRYIVPKPATENDLIKVHTQELIEDLKMRSKKHLGDSDNPFVSSTFEIAKLSAGAAIEAAKHSESKCFSLARPPGHHAGRNFFSGFCYLNNIAIGVSSVLKKYGRAMIVDFDVHLGQGTLDIFAGSDAVFYLSFHQNAETIYPWHEPVVREKNICLFALNPGIGDSDYLRIFEKCFKQAVSDFKPDLIACSAGFDAYYQDYYYVGSALSIREEETFKRIGEIIASADKPGFAVLEGGYNLERLGFLVYNFLRGWQK
ncbi:MAG: hypothetical protein N3F05_04750 [Candidatus Diapherotrites archaeon]|nr:hypothetical protein [Candidatus Diapherotrites archaeon]